MMINSFIPRIMPDYKPEKKDRVLLFRNSALYLSPGKRIPRLEEVLPEERQDLLYLGTLGKENYLTSLCPGEKEGHWEDLVSLYYTLGEEWFSLASYAFQLLGWNRDHRYCGRCGSTTVLSDRERSRLCPACKTTHYPRINPAVIVAVIKEDKILLARSHRFSLPFFSVLAGYVEAGETLEECVHREIKEEAGISVKEIRYFGSQSWALSSSIMAGFTARYAGGELKIDKEELAEGGWFTRDSLPRIPSQVSIAGKLINWFVENSG